MSTVLLAEDEVTTKELLAPEVKKVRSALKLARRNGRRIRIAVDDPETLLDKDKATTYYYMLDGWARELSQFCKAGITGSDVLAFILAKYGLWTSPTEVALA